MTHHRLHLVDRGGEHVHRWLPRCACGWVGIPARRTWAAEQYRGHYDGVESVAGAHRPHSRPVPRPVTPADELPEALRP